MWWLVLFLPTIGKIKSIAKLGTVEPKAAYINGCWPGMEDSAETEICSRADRGTAPRPSHYLARESGPANFQVVLELGHRSVRHCGARNRRRASKFSRRLSGLFGVAIGLWWWRRSVYVRPCFKLIYFAIRFQASSPWCEFGWQSTLAAAREPPEPAA